MFALAACLSAHPEREWKSVPAPERRRVGRKSAFENLFEAHSPYVSKNFLLAKIVLDNVKKALIDALHRACQRGHNEINQRLPLISQ